MEKKETSVWAFVFWLLIAIVGAGLLFTGIQSSSAGISSVATPILLIVVGIILVFIGLVMVLGKANIEAKKSK